MAVMRKFLKGKSMLIFWRKIVFFGAIFFLLSLSGLAFAPENRLSDQAQEERAMKLFLQIRCLVCSGQVIESSNTEFAYQMRQLVRKKIAIGKNDEEIKSELVREFGDDVLIAPNFKSSKGAPLWVLPLLFSLIAAVLLTKKILKHGSSS